MRYCPGPGRRITHADTTCPGGSPSSSTGMPGSRRSRRQSGPRRSPRALGSRSPATRPVPELPSGFGSSGCRRTYGYGVARPPTTAEQASRRPFGRPVGSVDGRAPADRRERVAGDALERDRRVERPSRRHGINGRPNERAAAAYRSGASPTASPAGRRDPGRPALHGAAVGVGRRDDAGTAGMTGARATSAAVAAASPPAGRCSRRATGQPVHGRTTPSTNASTTSSDRERRSAAPLRHGLDRL